jgi:hypothetical protein
MSGDHLVQHLIGTALKNASEDLKKLRYSFNHGLKDREGEVLKDCYAGKDHLP